MEINNQCSECENLDCENILNYNGTKYDLCGDCYEDHMKED